LFLGDYSLSIVMRATTELVDGVWQGACYPFREGLGNGILAVEFSPQGYLITGGTNRGWPVRGNRQYVLERLEWTGRTPFEIERIDVQRDGFLVTFTLPVDARAAVVPDNYRCRVTRTSTRKSTAAPKSTRPDLASCARNCSPTASSVHLTVEGMVLGHVHEFDLAGVRSAAGAPLLHKHAYYTLNRIPK
jgi:hypothetical protein